MSYLEQNRTLGEQVVFRTFLHWAVFLRPAIALAAALVVALLALAVASQLAVVAAALGLSALFLVGWAFRESFTLLSVYRTSEFGVTNQRVRLKLGGGYRKVVETRLAALESIGVEQGELGRKLDYGTLVVIEVGGRLKGEFPYVVNPMEFRKRAEQQKEIAKKPSKQWDIKQRQVGSVTVLELSGRIVYERSAELEKRLRSLITTGHTKLVLECSRVVAMDSSGIGALARGQQEAVKHGGKIKLARPSPRLAEGLGYVRFSSVIESYRDEEAALASFR